jgi:hypothetical protein
MTKTIVIGESANTEKVKPIEFCYAMDECHCTDTTNDKPNEFRFVELIVKNYLDAGKDIMFAYDDAYNRKDGVLYVGYWNNGVVKDKSGKYL